MYHYSIPPPGYVRYSYNTSATTSPSSSPCPDKGYNYYVPPHPKTPTASPTSRHTTKRHSRKESYSSSRAPGGWHSPAGYSPPPAYYTTTTTVPGPTAVPHDRQPYVSNIDRLKEKTRRHTASGGYGGGGDEYGHQRHASMQSPTPRIIVDTSDEADDSPFYTYIKPRAGSYSKKKYGEADPYYSYHQVHYDDSSDSQPQRSRARRSSLPSKSRPSPAAKPRAATAPPPSPPVATAADAAKAGIPAGYSTKNWDPTEAPVLLLGSVFDANSLGKWIYDWTVFHHGAATPMSDVAGDLWLLLIKLAGKMKRADECLPRIRARDNREMVEDFLESGDRLWSRFKKLLKACEEFMWKAAKKSGSKGSVKMGKNSGCEFVDSIFGRDRELEKTEGLMQSIRLWNMRFDANCEDILRRPGSV